MMKSYFTGIKPLLINQIQQAQHSIQIAVAWFTDNDVLEILLNKRKAGVSVKILISNDSKNFNESYSLDFTPFQQIGGKLMVVEESFMHHKFCIIDQTILLTGSANYTYNGFYKNKESISLIHEQETIADFLAEFERLAGQIQEENGVMVSQVIQSLHSQIKFYNHQISWLELELAEVQKHIELYEATYRLRFQRIIEEILWLQQTLLEHRAKLTEKAESKRRYQEAKQRWESFHSTIAEDAQTIEKGNDESLQETLKQLYREAVKLCHPDSPLVKEEWKEKAAQVFIKLKKAYDQNNVETLQEMLNELKLGIAFGNIDLSSVTVHDLEAFVQKLEDKVRQLATLLSASQQDLRYMLQTGDYVILQNHFEKEELLLIEKKRVLEKEVQRINNHNNG